VRPDERAGRPAQGARLQSTASTALPAYPVTAAVLEALADGEPATLAELGARLAARGVEVDGGESLALAQDPAVILWSGWRDELIDALVGLVAAGQVVLTPCRVERYNGARLDLPLAPSRPSATPLGAPCWLPATVAVAGRYRLAEPRWALVALARVRGWWR
jgi:hypothetical protein